MVEPELKVGFLFHRNSWWGKRVVQIMQRFILFLDQIGLEPEPKASRYWNRSQKILMPGAGAGAWNLSTGSNESGTQRTYWRYNCSVSYGIKNGEANMRNSHLLSRNYNSPIMPTRIKINGNFSDASVERFYSVTINRMMSPCNAADLGHSCNSLF